jgi:hypothetical protein
LSNLQILDISNSNIPYLPSWIITLKSLRHIKAHAAPCLIETEFGAFSALSSRPFSSANKDQMSRPRLADLAASRIRDYIDKGGDWTVLEDLPDHLMHKIKASYPSRSPEVQILKFHYSFYIVEKVNVSHLVGTGWSLYKK